MNFELQNVQKIEIAAEDKETVFEEFESIKEVLQSIEDGDENFAYADTSDSMDSIDEMLSEDPIYKETLAERKEASRKCMSEDETEKREGLEQIKKWVEKVKNLL